MTLSVPASLERSRTRSAAVTIVARPIPPSKTVSIPSADLDGSVLLHNAVLKRTLLPVVADILEKRYAVCITFPTSKSLRVRRSNRLAGSLASLANRGTALVNMRQYDFHDNLPTGQFCVANSLSTWKREYMSDTNRCGLRNNTMVDVDTYLREAHGTTWTAVLKWATGEAMKAAVEARERERVRISNLIEHTQRLRERLIEKAVSLEVAGAPLYMICAFTIVQKLGSSEIDCLEKQGYEYDSCLTRARQRMNSLGAVSNSSAQPSVHLVAALALP